MGEVWGGVHRVWVVGVDGGRGAKAMDGLANEFVRWDKDVGEKGQNWDGGE
jgi:hypothetical protein